MRDRFQSSLVGAVDMPWEPWVGAPAMTLAGFALENLLKGLAIAADPGLVQPIATKPNELLDPRIKKHKLVALAGLAGVELSTEEEALLTKLTEFVFWAGRYPTPLDAFDSKPRDGAESGGASFTSDWFDPLDALFDRLRSLLMDAAIRLAREQEVAALEEKRRRRPEIMVALERLKKVEIEPGVVVFESELSDEPGASISCNCGVTFNLNQRRPAGICRCDTLYFCEKRGVAGRIEFAVETFPSLSAGASSY